MITGHTLYRRQMKFDNLIIHVAHRIRAYISVGGIKLPATLTLVSLAGATFYFSLPNSV